MVGAGAWGTALAIQALRTGGAVSLWAREPGRIGRENPRLPGVVLPHGLRITGELPGRCDAIVVAVPMQHLRGVLARLRPQAPLLLCAKGMEGGTGLLPLEVAAALWPGTPAAVLTGPNFAREVARGLPAASVVAGAEAAVRQLFIAALGGPAFRLYGNDDALGAQVGGAAKNVIAIAAGAVIGAGLGENARAALVTRGLAEIARLVAALGGRAETAMGLSGLGDLLLTCTGAASRNFSYGVALARGERPEATAESNPELGGVVEGVATAEALVARASGVELPLCRAVADCVAGRSSVAQAMALLLARRLRDE